MQLAEGRCLHAEIPLSLVNLQLKQNSIDIPSVLTLSTALTSWYMVWYLVFQITSEASKRIFDGSISSLALVGVAALDLHLGIVHQTAAAGRWPLQRLSNRKCRQAARVAHTHVSISQLHIYNITRDVLMMRPSLLRKKN